MDTPNSRENSMQGRPSVEGVEHGPYLDDGTPFSQVIEVAAAIDDAHYYGNIDLSTYEQLMKETDSMYADAFREEKRLVTEKDELPSEEKEQASAWLRAASEVYRRRCVEYKETVSDGINSQKSEKDTARKSTVDRFTKAILEGKQRKQLGLSMLKGFAELQTMRERAEELQQPDLLISQMNILEAFDIL